MFAVVSNVIGFTRIYAAGRARWQTSPKGSRSSDGDSDLQRLIALGVSLGVSESFRDKFQSFRNFRDRSFRGYATPNPSAAGVLEFRCLPLKCPVPGITRGVFPVRTCALTLNPVARAVVARTGSPLTPHR